MKLKIILLLSTITALIIGLILIDSGIYSISSDETSRTLISYYWFTSGKLQTTSWLPLHFYILGAGFNFIEDLIWLPRLVSLIFGMMTIISVVLLTKEIFGSARVTVYSLFIILLIPQRVILGIVPLPEIIFFFFISSAALFFYKWLKERSPGYIIITSFLIAVSSGLRYEGWIFSALLLVFVLFRKLKKIKIPVILVLSAFPVFWLISNYALYGDFFHFLSEPVHYYALAQDDNLTSTIIFNPLMQFIEQGLITFNIIGLFGIFQLKKNPLIRKWLFVFLIPLIIFSLAALSGKGLPAHNFWRTSAVWMILLVPFTAMVLDKMYAKFSDMKTGNIIIILFFAQILNSNNYYIKNINKEICLTDRKMETARNFIDYIEGNAEEDDMVLIENISTFEHLDISLASKQPFRFVTSEKNSLAPDTLYDKTKLKINYYLLKSDKTKERLLNNSRYSKLLIMDGWILFGRIKTISQVKVTENQEAE